MDFLDPDITPKELGTKIRAALWQHLKRTVTERPVTMALGLAGSGFAFAAMEPWIAVPVAASSWVIATSTAVYKNIKKDLDDTMPEGEIWQRSHKRKTGALRSVLTLSLAVPMLYTGFKLLTNAKIDGDAQFQLYDDLVYADRAHKLQANQPIDFEAGGITYRLTVENIKPSEVYEGYKVYEGEASFTTRPVFKWQKPGQATDDFSLTPASGMPSGSGSAPPPPHPQP